MPRKLDVNIPTKEFIHSALKEGKRLDGRSLLDSRDFVIEFGNQLGIVKIKLGKSTVMASVSCNVTAPLPERPYEGQVNIYSELSAMSLPHYEAGQRGQTADEENSLNRLLEKSIRRSGMVDREALCIIAGEKVWSISITLHYLCDDGNLLDCGILAAACALLHFRRPEVTVIGTDITYHTEDERIPIPLAINHIPVSLTYVFFDDILQAVLDPTYIESQLSTCFLTITATPQRELLTVNKSGGLPLDPQTTIGCLEHATQRAQIIAGLIQQNVNEDLSKRRIGGVL